MEEAIQAENCYVHSTPAPEAILLVAENDEKVNQTIQGRILIISVFKNLNNLLTSGLIV